MSRLRRRSHLLLLLVVLVAAGCEERSAPGVGGPAPEFVLPTPAGAVRKLSSYRGRPIVLNLWATWCPPCIAELPVLNDIAKTYGDQGLVVLGLAGDENTQDVHDFLARNDVEFEVFLDANGEVGTDYGITGYPETFFIDRQGIIRDRLVGPLASIAGRPTEDVTRRIDALLGK